MADIQGRSARFFRRAARDEDGAATIEAVLWLPLFFVFFMLLVDATMIFSSQSQTLRIVQDANRGVSVGRFNTLQDAETFVLNGIAGISPNAQVQTTINNGIVRTQVILPTSDLFVTGALRILRTTQVQVTAQHLVEI